MPWLLLLACAAPDPVAEPPPEPVVEDTAPPLPACVADELVLEPGTGDRAFVPLDDGGSMEIMWGPAGPHYLDLAGLVRGSSGMVGVTGEAWWGEVRLDEAYPATAYASLQGWSPSACAGEFWGVRLHLDPSAATSSDWKTFLCNLEGDEIVVTWNVADLVTGARVAASRTVVAEIDPAMGCSSTP